MRNDCSSWCNVRGAATGVRPTAVTPMPHLLDAFFWIKAPGTSDGCAAPRATGQGAGYYYGAGMNSYAEDEEDGDGDEDGQGGSDCLLPHPACGAADAIGSMAGEPTAPPAGSWFGASLVELACRGSSFWADNVDSLPTAPSPLHRTAACASVVRSVGISVREVPAAPSGRTGASAPATESAGLVDSVQQLTARCTWPF